MKRQSLYFVAARRVELRTEDLPEPGAGEVRVKAVCSAISTGTELLLYKGEAPAALAADATLPALSRTLAYPLKYGYSMVGRVEAMGLDVEKSWQGRLVFAFNPHETAFNARVNDLLPLPKNCAEQDAAFLPAMETAVNLILDGEPRLGERVVVLGQGVIGLLATGLLARHPLDALIAFDRYPLRRELSLALEAQASLDPADSVAEAQQSLGARGADLVYELSGNPEALNLAMELVGDQGRIVVGSWYGVRRAALSLGERFHRGRVKIISSQVSHIEPALRGRWDRQRRFELAWKMLAEVQPSRLVTRQLAFDKAAEAYAALDREPEKNLAILLSY
ncbi:MAG: zinc-binding alcohol dehydrogenase [Anaerolineales bacterium]